jgi:hypothetical protein
MRSSDGDAPLARRQNPSRSTGPLLAVASVASLVAAVAAAGCGGGEQAFKPRDGSIRADGGGSSGGGTGGKGGAGGTGSATGAGGAGGAGLADGGVDRADSGSDGSADQPGGKDKGAPCSTGADCTSTYCFDQVCCDKDCSGKCMTCAGATLGACVFAPAGSDPREDCPTQPVNSCGTSGVCNGSGACRLYPANQVCDPVPACDSASNSAIPSRVCNGNGACLPSNPQSCGALTCNGGQCVSPCTDDSACGSASKFCCASTCEANGNIAGNGDCETDTTTGWAAFAGGTLLVSNAAASGYAHGGQYSIGLSGRGQLYQGPSYVLPTGAGQYTITGWGMQKDDSTMTGLLQVKLICASSTQYPSVQPGGAYGQSMDQGVWTMFSATIDFTATPDCAPDASPPGMVRSATLYLNQAANGTPVAMPDLYLDDVVVQVTDGHNLVGNPNLEAGFTDGWLVNTGAGLLGISGTEAHGGTRSLSVTSRSNTGAGPRYMLPIGAGRYNVSVWVEHKGTNPHDLVLQPVYSCIGGGQVTPPAIATASSVAGSTWTHLAGTVTFPPANAPATCKVGQASVFVQQENGTCGSGSGQVECPDMFLDDASITLTP